MTFHGDSEVTPDLAPRQEQGEGFISHNSSRVFGSGSRGPGTETESTYDT